MDKSLNPWHAGAFFLWIVGLRAARRRASAGNQPSRLDVMLYDAGLHNRSRNWARNWVHSRIWPSRDYFLSTPSTRKTTIVPLLSLVCRTACAGIAPHGPMTQRLVPPPCSSSKTADRVSTTLFSRDSLLR